MTTQTEQRALTVDVLDASGNKAGTADLPGEVFDVQTNVPLIHQVVVAQLAAARQGTHATKTRGDVRGGGKKPLRGALSDRARHGRVHVLTSLVDAEQPSTKTATAALAAVSERKNLLVVLQRSDEVSWKSLRNIDSVHVLVADQLNTYDVLCADDVIFTRGALEEFLAGPARGKGAKAVATEFEAAAEADASDAAVQSGDDSNTEEVVK